MFLRISPLKGITGFGKKGKLVARYISTICWKELQKELQVDFTTSIIKDSQCYPCFSVEEIPSKSKSCNHK